MVQSAFRLFAAIINGMSKNFSYGSIVLSVQLQNISPDTLFNVVSDVAKQTNINIYRLNTRYSSGGVDLAGMYVH